MNRIIFSMICVSLLGIFPLFAQETAQKNVPNAVSASDAEGQALVNEASQVVGLDGTTEPERKKIDDFFSRIERWESNVPITDPTRLQLYYARQNVVFNCQNPDVALSCGERVIAGLDAILADRPLGKGAEPYYQIKGVMARVLSELVPSYRADLDAWEKVCFELLTTRPNEIETKNIFCAALPAFELDTPERIERAQALLAMTEEAASERIDTGSRVTLLPLLAEADPAFASALAEEIAAVRKAYEQALAEGNEKAESLRGNYAMLLDAQLGIACRSFSAATSAEAIRTMFAQYRELTAVTDPMFSYNMLSEMSQTALVGKLAPETRTVYTEECQALSEWLRTAPSRQSNYGDITLAAAADALDEMLPLFTLKNGPLDLLGKPLELEGVTTEGTPFDWSAYRGKIVLVDFWTTSCMICIEEMPRLQSIYQKYRDQGFEIVGVCSGHDRSIMLKIIEKTGTKWTTLDDMARKADNQEMMGQRYPHFGVPYQILIGRDGKCIVINDESTRGDHLEATVQSLLSEGK